MTQVENEYGNFGSDHGYMAHLNQSSSKLASPTPCSTPPTTGATSPTAPSPTSSQPSTFGIGNHQGGMNALSPNSASDAPIFVSEYWPGWFDSWGHPHETRPIPPQLEDLDYILHRGAGINIYMFHGGTSFGFMSGAGSDKNGYRPTVTSYDYDAPSTNPAAPPPSSTPTAKS